MQQKVIIIGGGLAGVEAAYQVAKSGLKAEIYEMRQIKTTSAHKTDLLAELVCSNSLKSFLIENASGILKKEMQVLDSVIINAAYETKVPAGKALAVDRNKFSNYITNLLNQNANIEIIREEFSKIPVNLDVPVVIASGPLTSDNLSNEIKRITDTENLFFYDSISPIIDAESIDYTKTFAASRYDYNTSSDGDYINCPQNKEQYENLVRRIREAEKIEIREFEKGIYFESCLPVEVIADRGIDTLRFGPLRPVGLMDPRTKKVPYAVVQLRRENLHGTMYNMVGFQTKLKYPEQRRVFRSIPGLEKAEFMRYGSVHRNTYINSPSLLEPTLKFINMDLLFFAGQITGVEGYVESAATGIIAGINASRLAMKLDPVKPPSETAIGSLLRYITNSELKKFQPMNINFGLFPPIEKKLNKSQKKKYIYERAIEKIKEFKKLTI
ncbi:MAG: methylenetetrahydrofolate--tRNA-(uracil(54)-C(5))-methyltransferase (FADH(2)-oxidizing) TrmFO [Thermodesulfobacteriota bacterium]